MALAAAGLVLADRARRRLHLRRLGPARAPGHGPRLRPDHGAFDGRPPRTALTPSDAGVASATVNTMQQVGGSIGTAFLSTMFADAVAAFAASGRHPGRAGRGCRPPSTATRSRSGGPPAAFAVGAVVTALLFRPRAARAERPRRGRARSRGARLSAVRGRPGSGLAGLEPADPLAVDSERPVEVKPSSEAANLAGTVDLRGPRRDLAERSRLGAPIPNARNGGNRFLYRPGVVPAVPRLPFVPDLLRRIRLPRRSRRGDDGRATEAPGGGSIGTEGVERIWGAALALYRSGVHPAVQVCVRREGEVVLDRAIGHARGNGPGDPADAEKVPATPETPFTVYSASKAITAFVVHKQIERGLIAPRRPGGRALPRLRAPRQGRDHDRPGALAPRGGAQPAARGARASNTWATASTWSRPCATRSRSPRRASASPTTRSRAASSSPRSSSGSPARRSARSWPRSSSIRSDFAGPTTGWRPRTSSAVGLNYMTGAPVLPPLSTFLTRALGASPTDVVTASNDPRFITAIIPAGERGDDGERALAVLRGDAPRRRARRRPGDRAETIRTGAHRAVPPRDRLLAGLPDPFLATG